LKLFLAFVIHLSTYWRGKKEEEEKRREKKEKKHGNKMFGIDKSSISTSTFFFLDT